MTYIDLPNLLDRDGPVPEDGMIALERKARDLCIAARCLGSTSVAQSSVHGAVRLYHYPPHLYPAYHVALILGPGLHHGTEQWLASEHGLWPVGRCP